MLYARVSPKGSDWNAEETSVVLQIQEMKEYILRRDPSAEFLEETDEFKSGKDLKRPGMQRILEDLELPDPPWGTLVVWALDRLSRSLADAVPIFEKLRDAGRGFICVKQDYLSTQGAMARFTLNQTILVAQLEREMTSERVKAKMVFIAEKGKVPFGKLPIGYRRISGVKNSIEIDPETAPIVQDIFRAYLAQTGTIVELRQQYAQYIRNQNQLYRLLRNRLYLGEVEYDGKVYQGQHPAIIDRQTFDRVAALLPGHRSAPRPGRQKYQYLLQGLVYCECGKKMVPYSVTKKDGKRYFYYKCQDTAFCKYALSAPAIDQDVMDQLLRVAVDPEYLRERYAQHEQETLERESCIKQRLEASSASVSEAEKAVSQIENLFTSGVVLPSTAEHWNNKLAHAQQTLDVLKKQHADLKESLTPKYPADFAAVLSSIQNWVDIILSGEDDYTHKRNLVLAIVKHVRCLDKAGNMELHIVMSKSTKWRTRRDSNPRPLAPEANALSS